jgi:trichothecene 3-O-acetyltransferase
MADLGMLDTLGQLPGLNLYTQICLCYPVADTSQHDAIIDTLQRGLQRLAVLCPWLAAQVVNEDVGPGNTGVFRFRPLSTAPFLVVKDLSRDSSAPTMTVLREARFPFRLLDEGTIAPRSTLPGASYNVMPDLLPVLVVQATFIDGGLILTIVGHHGAMDMTGQAQVMRLLSLSCRGESPPAAEQGPELYCGRRQIPLLDAAYEPGPELTPKLVRPGSLFTPNPDSVWSYFAFDEAALASIKSRATKSITAVGTFVSTDDALTAYIWQSITRIRLPRLGSGTESKLARAVDVRTLLDVPAAYPGLVQNMTHHASSAAALVDAPLGQVATGLRAAIDPATSTLGRDTRALATLLARRPNKNEVSFTANMDFAKDIALSSWARYPCYDLDFGLALGKPEAVRRPQFTPVEGLIYLLPRAPDGTILVAICLARDDMTELAVDYDFAALATQID